MQEVSVPQALFSLLPLVLSALRVAMLSALSIDRGASVKCHACTAFVELPLSKPSGLAWIRDVKQHFDFMALFSASTRIPSALGMES
jgi:hypothetical protein